MQARIEGLIREDFSGGASWNLIRGLLLGGGVLILKILGLYDRDPLFMETTNRFSGESMPSTIR